MNGAQIFETLVFVPKWTESAPENFKLLLDGELQAVGYSCYFRHFLTFN
jgi:hypothetical protein